MKPGADGWHSDEIEDYDQEMSDFDDIAMAGYSDDDDAAAAKIYLEAAEQAEQAAPLTPRSNHAEMSAVAAEVVAANAAQNAANVRAHATNLPNTEAQPVELSLVMPRSRPRSILLQALMPEARLTQWCSGTSYVPEGTTMC